MFRGMDRVRTIFSDKNVDPRMQNFTNVNTPLHMYAENTGEWNYICRNHAVYLPIFFFTSQSGVVFNWETKHESKYSKSSKPKVGYCEEQSMSS